MMFKIGTEDPGQAEVLSLLEEGEVFAASLYPAESNHFLSVDELRAPNVRFFVARDTNGVAAGTGAVAIHNEWAEVKRMWVTPPARGNGISKALFARIDHAAENCRAAAASSVAPRSAATVSATGAAVDRKATTVG